MQSDIVCESLIVFQAMALFDGLIDHMWCCLRFFSPFRHSAFGKPANTCSCTALSGLHQRKKLLQYLLRSPPPFDIKWVSYRNQLSLPLLPYMVFLGIGLKSSSFQHL